MCAAEFGRCNIGAHANNDQLGVDDLLQADEACGGIGAARLDQEGFVTFSKVFSKFATVVARTTGRPVTFALCLTVIILWAVSGPLFHFSDTWQLVINTGTTIITFLQVFLIQNTQNRDGAAIQAKLDELIRVSAARDQFMGVEDLTEEELTMMRTGEGDAADSIRVEKALAAADEAEATANERATIAAKAAKPKFT